MSGRRYRIIDADRIGSLGFYGCATAGRSRIVRVAWAGEGKPPKAAVVTCPVCAAEHLISPLWRKRTDADEGREPELVIDGEGVVDGG